jgi:predicted MFS family arabinose efflux permease
MIAVVPLAFASDSAGGLAAFTVAVRWFRRRRGRAVAIMAMAISAGSMIVPPVAAYLIAAQGWRAAVASLGFGAGLLIVCTALAFVRGRPSDEELRSAGEEIPHSSTEARCLEKKVWTYRELLTNSNFLLLMFGAGLLVASDRAVLVSVGPYLADAGYGVEDAALVLSVLGGAALGGMMLVGYLAERLDPRKIFAMIMVLHVALLLLFMSQPSYGVMLAGAAIVGLGIGGVLPAKQVLMACSFGSTSYGTVLGTGSMILQILMMAALRFIGEVYDRTGTYNLAFGTFIGVAVISGVLVWQVRVNQPAQAGTAIPAS